MKALVQIKDTSTTKDRLKVIPDEPVLVTLSQDEFDLEDMWLKEEHNNHLPWGMGYILLSDRDFDIILIKEK
ncbi:hypothetical protein VOWphi5012_083 [Vibrio phage phi50-12]|uniref:Uncharacterized protein n=1 Tax=Vibrio phage phi50-12 TaxID=2654972 RepID=A0A5P8PRE8_9CAUD|nr:hypothetical protein KNU82_gp083 [Vibrio phage phi50-12]QFR59867.1 hypothetical protein VOWphi5012_083 [Vibrio phage phi50-12]